VVKEVQLLLVGVNSTDIQLLDECPSLRFYITDEHRDTQKATDQAWGNEATSWESAAPIAEADHNEEKKEIDEPPAVPEEVTTGGATTQENEKQPEEEEQKQTYAEWLANKNKSDFMIHEARKPDQSKWEGSTSLLAKKNRTVEEGLFGEGEGSAQKVKTTTSAKKTAPKKVVLEIEQRFTPIRSGRGGDKGGRGGSRGSGERGGRGRGDGPSRGRGRGEGSGRGRGGNRIDAQTIDVADTTAFPALG
jgi:plasminogen activator inhibitor 1 RNA-binding protein